MCERFLNTMEDGPWREPQSFIVPEACWWLAIKLIRGPMREEGKGGPWLGGCWAGSQLAVYALLLPRGPTGRRRVEVHDVLASARLPHGAQGRLQRTRQRDLKTHTTERERGERDR